MGLTVGCGGGNGGACSLAVDAELSRVVSLVVELLPDGWRLGGGVRRITGV